MSAPLEKAILQRLKEIPGGGADQPPRVVPDDNGDFPVQFNPTSLKITRQNNIDQGGATTNTQRRQTPSQQPATLSFDLEYDTAEGDEYGDPKDVRELTEAVRQFVEPPADQPSDPPPRVRFIWGAFVFTGIVNQLTEDLDYFAADGTPLRAKMSLTITEQNLKFEAEAQGAGARSSSDATPPGGGPAGAGPGSGPTTNPVLAAIAQAGESVQQLLSRLDADPATWRAAMAGLESPLSLQAGAEIQLGAKISAGGGIGISAGFAAGAQVSATASLAGALGVSAGLGAGGSVGLSAASSVGFTTGASAVVSQEVAAGFALAEGGGVAASLNVVVAAQADAAVGQARASFGVPSATRPPAVIVDPRSQSYGRSIPLRARAPASTVADVSTGGVRSLADVQQRRRDAGDNTMRWTPGR
jgi:Contractile injection system tube protein